MGCSLHEVWIDADESTVFDALTTTDGLNGWWGEALTATPEVGSTIELDHGLDEPMRLRIDELHEPSLVVWRFLNRFTDPDNPASEWEGQTFRFEIDGRGTHRLIGTEQHVTVVRMVNDGWPDGARWQGFCTTAWGVTLETKLKPFCETGATSTGMVGG